MSYLQMYSAGMCYVLFRWDMAWGKKLFLCLAVLVLSDQSILTPDRCLKALFSAFQSSSF